ncbi:Pfs domain protein [Trichodelitschia bisporula]|uniref:Pfs domain protein n=1 Tax=Trichodelitschia bisporula TaxID=703511 RepID=A0A6G1HHW9_9PEZI|nr:Pfs domain protein [Trichodelitschia bisporula]
MPPANRVRTQGHFRASPGPSRPSSTVAGETTPPAPTSSVGQAPSLPSLLQRATDRESARRLRHEDYTIGWICALPNELAAAKRLLDTEHAPFPQGPDDPTFPYNVGRMGSHNVVIACLPAGRPGTNSALSVALQMRSMFKSIQYGLMVGIGGGVPSPKNNLRLGDVVFSQPDGAYGGVVQYAFGKDIPGGLRRTGHLSAPPEHLLNALQELKIRHSERNFGFLEHLSKLTEPDSPFIYPDASSDFLFPASYRHVDSDDAVGCAECAREKRINRDRWQTRTGDVQVHFGTIASDNRLMRDGERRDEISKKLGGVLCFEMEAAGLMNHFPCLVIRGISDYSDSHKSDDWQKYAAATAASCAKEILLLIRPVASQLSHFFLSE